MKHKGWGIWADGRVVFFCAGDENDIELYGIDDG